MGEHLASNHFLHTSHVMQNIYTRQTTRTSVLQQFQNNAVTYTLTVHIYIHKWTEFCTTVYLSQNIWHKLYNMACVSGCPSRKLTQYMIPIHPVYCGNTGTCVLFLSIEIYSLQNLYPSLDHHQISHFTVMDFMIPEQFANYEIYDWCHTVAYNLSLTPST